MPENILVYSEAPKNILELATAARSLGGTITALVVGSADDAQSIASTGIDRVIHVPADTTIPAEAYAETVAAAVASTMADTVLISVTAAGRAVAGMIAQKFDAPCASECRTIEAVDGGIAITRAIYGGKADSHEQATAPLVIATIPLHVFEAASAQGSPASIEQAEAPVSYPVKVTEVIAEEGDTVDITAANALVLVGRGCSKQEDLQIAQDLAEAIGGIVACTRPIAEDYHWFSTERYVGMSGKQVKPKLLIAMGVSGQIQCLAGATDSKLIVGINTDENAPLLPYSDYFVNGDLYTVVPEITKAVKALQ